MQTFTNVKIKVGSFVGFHYDSAGGSQTVVPYTMSSGVGSRSLQKFGLSLAMGKSDADLPSGVTLTQSQFNQMRRVPMAAFYVDSKGNNDNLLLKIS